MNTTYEITTRLEPEVHPEFDGIRGRFQESFEDFVNARKREALDEVLAAEAVIPETLVNDPAFLDAVIRRVPDDAVVEKRYIFLSVNPSATLV